MSNKKPEAEILLDEQLSMASKTKLTDIITMVIFLILIFGITVLFWALPDKEYSGEEKRALKQMPEISAERFAEEFKQGFNEIFMTYDEKQAIEKNDSMFDEIADYYADQFPARNTLRTVKGYTELAMLKRQSNGILFINGGLVNPDTVTGEITDENGKSVERTDEDALSTIQKNVTLLNLLNTKIKDNATLYTAVAGRTVDVSSSYLPNAFADRNAQFWTRYSDACSKTELKTIDLLTPLTERYEDGEYVYYKTDHHWTTLGAYYAYVEIMHSFGETPLSLEDFDIQIQSDDFLGTVYAKAGIAPTGADKVSLFRFDSDNEFTTTIPVGNEITSYQGFYNMSYLDTADQYSVFLGHDNTSFGGNNPITIIKKNTDEKRETLVLIKDSFAHSVAPFLAYHYDLIILDMRYYTPNGEEFKTVSQYASQDDISKILVLYNMETFMNDSSVMRAVK